MLNNHTYNQCEVDLFELMCSVIERSLFAQVDWARNSIFFRDLKVSIRSGSRVISDSGSGRSKNKMIENRPNKPSE